VGLRRRDEEGSTTILVAIMATVLFGMAAIVVDAGEVWAARRQLITATDAAALAAVQEYALGGNGCAGVAGSYIADNYPQASLDTCNHTGNRIEVGASVEITHHFAPILGRSSTTVDASVHARYGVATSATGLRPFGLCSRSDGFQAWQQSLHSTNDIFRITYTKDALANCGTSIPGNWGIIDFDGGSNSNSDTKAWVQYGYPGTVSVPGTYDGDPGAFSTALPINSIVGQKILLPVFDNASGTGANATFDVIGVVGVIIWDYRANGPESSRYLDVEFVTTVLSGHCCDPTSGALDAGVVGVEICGYESITDCL
jgi:hypothetical protein